MQLKATQKDFLVLLYFNFSQIVIVIKLILWHPLITHATQRAENLPYTVAARQC